MSASQQEYQPVQNPITPPTSEHAESQFDFSSKFSAFPADSAIDMQEDDPFEFTTVSEQEPDITHPYLLTHAKVYATAEK